MSDRQARTTSSSLIHRTEVLVILPALMLTAFWIGGERLLLIAALGLPLLTGMARLLWPVDPQADPGAELGQGGQTLLPQVEALLDNILRSSAETGRTTACLVLRLDEIDKLVSRRGIALVTEVLERAAERALLALREGDRLALVPDGGFAIALRAERSISLESMIRLAARLQATLATAFTIEAEVHHVTFSIGFCPGLRSPRATGLAILTAAGQAADEAVMSGPGAIRAYTPDVANRQIARSALREDLELALDEGQIRPHFQPQISTDTGAISGMEALARWHHPLRGLVPPGDFLPAIEAAGLSERLGEVIMFQALSALSAFDRAGLKVPMVAVNFSTAELRNPRLAEKLQWDLDRFDLAPQRLSVEILETVVAETDNDIVVRNIAALAEMGCGIDLDDFGTGNASIGSIRRFAVRRIKIDRSFVTHVDSDRDQQKMIEALVSLADRLGLETLAEGVENPAEHAILAQLGCKHVQGFGIARPMPQDEMRAWVLVYMAKAPAVPQLARRAGKRVAGEDR